MLNLGQYFVCFGVGFYPEIHSKRIAVVGKYLVMMRGLCLKGRFLYFHGIFKLIEKFLAFSFEDFLDRL